MTAPFASTPVLYYSPSAGTVFTSTQLSSNFGINLNTISLDALNAQGFYLISTVAPQPDPLLYANTPTYTIVGQYAEQGWSSTALPLATAKITGSSTAKSNASTATAQVIAESGLSTDVLTSVASQDPLARPADFQAVLDATTAVSDQLATNLAAIDAATNVDTINNIINQPYGTIMTGRGAPGQAGPLDLNLSYFTAIEDLGFPESALELYIPGTDTVIPYTDSLPEPYHFDSMGNCFADGDWRMVIRMADSGAVLSTITVSEGVDIPVDWTYNPVIPGLGGGSHHEAF